MKVQKQIPKDQTTEFIETITSRLNHFFNTISKQAYTFQCVHTPGQTDEKTIELKKAYRIFKKFLINQKLIDPQLGQKARQRFATKVWQQLNENQKLKYFDNKHHPPIHYLQKIVASVAKNRNAKLKNTEKPKSKQQIEVVSSPAKQEVEIKDLQKIKQNGKMKIVQIQ